MNKRNRGHRGGLNPNHLAPTVIGQSALGNNEVADNRWDGSGNKYTGIGYVPLVFDPISGTYCAPLSKVNQEERLQALEVTRVTFEDMSFLYRAGFVNGPNQPVNVI